jgi:hypothetical protein
MFEFTNGYDGKIQFAFGHKAPTGGGHNGLLVDTGAFPKLFNVTLCGEAQNNVSYGFVWRGNSRFNIANGIFTGWGGGFDYTSTVAPGDPLLLRNAVFANNGTNPAFDEQEAGTGEQTDDDLGFNELEFFGDGGANSTNNPNLVACHDGANPQPWPNAAINGATPPADGFFDTNANYIGAFKDSNDGWMKGAWVKFTDP